MGKVGAPRTRSGPPKHLGPGSYSFYINKRCPCDSCHVAYNAGRKAQKARIEQENRELHAHLAKLKDKGMIG